MADSMRETDTRQTHVLGSKSKRKDQFSLRVCAMHIEVNVPAYIPRIEDGALAAVRWASSTLGHRDVIPSAFRE